MRSFASVVGRWGTEAAVVVIASLLLLAWLHKLPGRDLSVPFAYRGDALENVVQVKMLAERGWPLSHPDMGAPYGLTFHDYQRAATVQFGLLWFVSLFTSDPFLITNVYFLLTFPLAALIAFGAFRTLGVRFSFALPASLLYAFLPYHHFRGTGHLFLSGYFFVPASALLVIWVHLDLALFRREESAGKRRLPWRGWAALVLAAFIGSTEIYYAFFACLLLLVAGAVVAVRKRRLWSASPAVILCVAITASALASLSPQFAYRLEHGANPDAGLRSAWDAQSYDLRVLQMIMPTTDHRLPALAKLKADFNRQVRQTESDFASLGLVGTLGLLYLLARAVLRPRAEDEVGEQLDAASVSTLASVLIGSVGGFVLVAASLFPSIRCYNRLSVFVAFFALLAVARFGERLVARFQSRLVLTGAVAFTVVMTIACVWEQTPAFTSKQDPAVVEAVARDREFVAKVEQNLAPGAMVFQAPYIVFPEGRSTEFLTLSIHSRSTRWTFPSMRGRASDLWVRSTWELGVSGLIDRLARAGFAGVSWDRSLCTPEELALLAEMTQRLGQPQFSSADGKYLYFSLANHSARLREGESAEVSERRRIEALYPVVLRWGRGFQSGAEVKPRWGNRSAEATLLNQANSVQRAVLELVVQGNPAGPGSLRIHGLGADQTHRIDEAPQTIRVPLAVPSGRSVLHFECDAPRHPEFARRHFLVVSSRLIPVEDSEAIVGTE